jgi:pyruvate dehydrogenase E1 component
MDCLSRLGRSDGTSSYLRLSTRPVRQELAAIPVDSAARERRRHVVVGGYVLWRRRQALTSPWRPWDLVTDTIAAAD